MIVSALDAGQLGRILATEFRAAWLDELPVCRRDVPEVRDDFLATGLLGPRTSVYVVATGDVELFAQAYVASDTRDWRTLRLGIAAGTDVPTELAGDALRALATHLLRTTSILKVERLVEAADARGVAICARAGLQLAGTRVETSPGDGLPREYDVYAFNRPPRAPGVSDAAS